MKRYEVYIYKGFHCWLRSDTDDLQTALNDAIELEKNSNEDFEGTAIYDNKTERWFNRHERGTSYKLSK